MAGALFGNFGDLIGLAIAAARRAKDTSSDGTSDDALVAIIMAASAAESFINDLVGTILFLAEVHGSGPTEALGRLRSVAAALDALENQSKPSTQAKYLCAAVLLGCPKISQGIEPMQSFAQVTTLRNAIVHAKPVSPDDIGKQAKVVESLAKRGLCNCPTEPPSIPSWMHAMRTPAVAWWAVRSCVSLMIALGDGIAAFAEFGGLGRSQSEFLNRLLQDVDAESGHRS
jgi:hypothetical protein